MRDRGIDYFEKSRRATHVQQQYAIRNPLEFESYGAHCWGKVYPETKISYGFAGSFNPTYSYAPGDARPILVCQVHYGLNQGPNVLMIENYRSGLLWRLMRRYPYLVTELRRAGFATGWL